MEKIVLFLDKKIRMVWDDKSRRWMFSVVDIIAALTGTSNPRRYWSDLKRTVKASACKGNAKGIYALRKVVQFKLAAKDGKMRPTDIASGAALLRIIRLIPSPMVKPLKEWLKSAGRGVTMLPEPLLSLTKPKAANRLLRAGGEKEPFLLLNVSEDPLEEGESLEENAAENEIAYIKTAARGAFNPAKLFFPWSVRLSLKNPACGCRHVKAFGYRQAEQVNSG